MLMQMESLDLFGKIFTKIAFSAPDQTELAEAVCTAIMAHVLSNK